MVLDQKYLEEIRNYLPRVSEAKDVADYFFIFSDLTRVYILFCLSLKELCVGELCSILSVNQSTISHQLKLLKTLKIVDCRRDKSLMFYRIINPFVNEVIKIGLNQVNYNISKF